ncbi:MAG TPA: hypothetical protein VFV41_08480 [Streptosporangiaceae bacterium]|nr:hypothetical protein [Streptosporangiaceae bacterium]
MRTARALAVLAGAAAALAVTAPAMAAPQARTVTAFTVMDDHGDTGGAGNFWAIDKIIRKLVIHQTGGSAGAYTFTATVTDSGSFTTIKDALTPNQGEPFTGSQIVAAVQGTMAGGASYEFTASSLPRAGLVPTQEFGRASSGPRTTALWYEQAFPPGTTFGGTGILPTWSWTYTGPACTTRVPGGVVTTHEQWVNGATDNGQLPADGNITGGCPVG